MSERWVLVTTTAVFIKRGPALEDVMTALIGCLEPKW